MFTSVRVVRTRRTWPGTERQHAEEDVEETGRKGNKGLFVTIEFTLLSSSLVSEVPRCSKTFLLGRREKEKGRRVQGGARVREKSKGRRREVGVEGGRRWKTVAQKKLLLLFAYASLDPTVSALGPRVACSACFRKSLLPMVWGI